MLYDGGRYTPLRRPPISPVLVWPSCPASGFYVYTLCGEGDSICGRRGADAAPPREGGGAVHATFRAGVSRFRRQPAAFAGTTLL